MNRIALLLAFAGPWFFVLPVAKADDRSNVVFLLVGLLVGSFVAAWLTGHLRVEVLRAGRAMRLDARNADPFEGYVDAGNISPQLAGTRVNAIIDSSQLGNNSGIAVGRVTEDSPAWRS